MRGTTARRQRWWWWLPSWLGVHQDDDSGADAYFLESGASCHEQFDGGQSGQSA